MISCERELVWRGDAQQLDFAPLARFADASGEAARPRARR